MPASPVDPARQTSGGSKPLPQTEVRWSYTDLHQLRIQPKVPIESDRKLFAGLSLCWKDNAFHSKAVIRHVPLCNSTVSKVETKKDEDANTHGKVQGAEVSNLSAAWCCAIIEQVRTNNGFLGKSVLQFLQISSISICVEWRLKCKCDSGLWLCLC